MVRILSDEDVGRVLSLGDLLPVVESAFEKQGVGRVERPPRPHFPVGIDLNPMTPGPLGTGLIMPAYLHGEHTFATKLASVHDANAERGLATVNAQIVVTDASNGQPLAFLSGTRVTNARTGCIGGLAARELATKPVRLGLIGAGTQAHWQARAIAAATDLAEIRVYSPTASSREACASTLERTLEIESQPVESPDAAIRESNVVVTATTSETPVLDGDSLVPGTVVIGIGAYDGSMQELDPRTLERASRIFADVPEEVMDIGDLTGSSIDPNELVPLSDVLAGRAGRNADEEILVVESVGSAVLDAAAADHVYGRAEALDIGTVISI